MEKIKRWLPLLVIVILMGVAYMLGVTDYFTFEELKMHRETAVELVSKYWILAPLIFIAVYMISTALSLPIGIFLSLAGGFLFPQPFSTLYVVVGATLGASIIFLAAKTAVGDTLRQKAGSRLKKMEKGFRENSVSYLLFLRLVPLFPFWLVNLAPAFFGVSLAVFVWTTFVGIIPGAFVITQAGTGLGAILDSADEFSLGAVFNWHVKVALVALGLFALLPIVIKKLRKKT